MVVGPIAVAYNLEGRRPAWSLDPGRRWPRSSAARSPSGTTGDRRANTGATLPDADIKVFFRSDESGTTENFEKYLAAALPGRLDRRARQDLAGGIGQGKAKSPRASRRAVKATDGSIAYVEWSFAKDNAPGRSPKIDNGGGAVELTAESGRQGASPRRQPVGTGNDLKLKLDYATKAAGAYPIVLVTYEIVCSKGLDAAKTALLKSLPDLLRVDRRPAEPRGARLRPAPGRGATKVADAPISGPDS